MIYCIVLWWRIHVATFSIPTQSEGHILHTKFNQLVNETFPSILQQTMKCFVLSTLKSYATVAVPFDMWMLRTEVDTFCLVVSFIDNDWELRHITTYYFEASYTT